MDPDPAGFRVVGSGPDPAGTKMSRSGLDPDLADLKTVDTVHPYTRTYRLHKEFSTWRPWLWGPRMVKSIVDNPSRAMKCETNCIEWSICHK